MALPKLYMILRQLPEKVLDQFTRYLESPFHNTHGETVRLWQHLSPHHPNYEISDDAVFVQAFPERPYDNARLRVLRTYLMDHLEDFLVLQELGHNAIDRRRLLRNAAVRYGLGHLRKEAWDTIAGPVFFEPELALEEFVLRRDALQAAMLHQNRSLLHDLNFVLKPLDIFYVVQKLKYFCALAEPITNHDPLVQNPELGQVLALYAALDLHSQPLAAIYFHLLHLYLGPDKEAHTTELSKLLQLHHRSLDPKEMLNVYTHWYNHLNLQLRRGSANAPKAIFVLYQEMVACNAFFGHGSISAHHFRNLIFIATVLQQFEWAQQFLDAHSHRLELPWRTGVHAYCNGYLLFAQGRYSDAKRQLMGVGFYDVEYVLNHKILFLQIYYETDDLPGLESVKDALKIYVYRSKDLTSINKASANNFAKFAVKLFHLKALKSRRAAAEKAMKEMQSCKQLRARSWLYEKAEELARG
jgi:hypothetical protein